MKSRILPIIAQIKHVSFGWYSNYLAELSKGASKRGYIVDIIYSINDLTRFEGERYVVVMGSDDEWLEEVFERLKTMGIQGIVENGNSPQNSLFNIHTDTLSIIKQSLQLFQNNNRTNVAFFGAKRNDSSDKIKVDSFCAEYVGYDEEDIYYTEDSIEECFNRFLKKADKYDAVLCADDIAGVYFIGACHKVGISIPEDIYVTGNGNICLRHFCSPTLTTFVNQMYYEKVQPKMFVKIYDILTRYPQISCLTLVGKTLMLEGGSTGGKETGRPQKRHNIEHDDSQRSVVRNNADPDIHNLCMINHALRACDDVDIGILSMLFAGEKNSDISISMYVSMDTVKYRLKRIYKRFGVSGKGELTDLVSKYGLCFEIPKK